MSPATSRSHHDAHTFAEFAESAKVRGEVGRSISLYEQALNYEIDAINECLSKDPLDIQRLQNFYSFAVRYAQKCGRHRKAEHLQQAASALAADSAELEVFGPKEMR